MSILRQFTLLLLIHTSLLIQIHANAEPAVPSAAAASATWSNVTNRVLENRLVQNIRTATASLSQTGKQGPGPQTPEQKMSAMTIKDMLKILEAQNARVGDSCDASSWTTHVKPIYDALYMGNIVEQNMRNDAFAMAILKDHSIISKVCLSAAHIMECQAGTCECLTKLPADLKYAMEACKNATTGPDGSRSDNAEAGPGALAMIMGFFQNLFAFSSGHERCLAHVETVAFCLVGIVCHFVLFGKSR